MIKFFRKIRQKLLEQNRVSKYLLYAFGEIILVVIGILIALQINNWNENRKQEAKTQNYYHQLLEDLLKDKIFAKETIAKFESQRSAYQNYLSEFKNPDVTMKEMYKGLIELNSESYALDFNTSTIEALQNSGEIVLIPPILRNKLVDLKRKQEKIARDESLDNRGKTGVIENLSLYMGSLSLDERLENNKDLKNALGTEKNLSTIVLGLEAIQDWMHFSELKSIRLLKELIKEIEILEDLIQNKVN